MKALIILLLSAKAFITGNYVRRLLVVNPLLNYPNTPIEGKDKLIFVSPPIQIQIQNLNRKGRI